MNHFKLLVFLCIVLIAAIIPLTAYADQEGVSYRYPVYKTVGETTTAANGIDHWENGTCSTYTMIDAKNLPTTWGSAGTDSWYVVKGGTSSNPLKISQSVVCNGNVHLILTDGCFLVATHNKKSGINVTGGNSLTIYGQSEGTGTLSAETTGWAAGIGGDCDQQGYNITINGGNIKAKSQEYGAGIGGGYSIKKNTAGYNIIINDGVVEASSGLYGAGIGGGSGSSGRDIIINGGDVLAKGGSGESNGGSIIIGGNGIGGGNDKSASNITINDGKVIAIGGIKAMAIGSNPSNIVIAKSQYIKGGNDANSAYVIANTDADMSSKISGKLYLSIIRRSKVTFDTFGIGTNIDDQYVFWKEKVIKPNDPSEKDMAFVGWYKETTLDTLWDFDNETVKEDTTLYAKWVGHINTAEVESIEDKEYTGSQIKPEPVLKIGETELKKDVTYTLDYKDNVNIGTATVIIKGINALGGTIEKTFKIVKANPTAANFDFSAPDDTTYNNKEKPATFTGKNGATGFGNITVYYSGDNGNTWTKNAPSTPGTYKVKIDVAGGDNFYSAENLTDENWKFTINKATPNADNFSISDGPMAYDGKKQDVLIEVSDETIGKIKVYYCNASGTTWTEDEPVNAGTYNVKIDVEESSNFNGVTGITGTNLKFNIMKATPTVDIFQFTTPASLVYDSNKKTVTAELLSEYTGVGEVTTVYSEDDGQNWSSSAPADAGEYIIGLVIAEGDNFNSTNDDPIVTDIAFSISKRPVTLTSASAKKIIDGDPLTDNKVTVGGEGFAGEEGATYDVTGSQTEIGSSANSFTYELNKGTKAENYDITKVEGTLTVTYYYEGIPAKAATCTNAGNRAYWYCPDLDKYYSDPEGNKEIKKGSWTVKATGHRYRTVSAGKGCTYNQCTACGFTSDYAAPSYVKSFKLKKGRKCFNARWKKQSKKNRKKFSGYQIRYSTDPNMNGAVYKNISKNKSSVTIKKLGKKTRYYVQLRTYTGGFYSGWSTKSIVTK